LQDFVGNSDITIVYCSLNFENVFYIDHYTKPNTKVKEAGHMGSGYPEFYKAYMDRYLHIDEQDPTQNRYMDDVLIDGAPERGYAPLA
jgi:hypothetical protein